MKPPILLKIILDICLFFLIIGLISSVSIFVFQLVTGDKIATININGIETEDFNTPVLILISIEILIAALFIYTIYILRKLIRNFFKGKLFTVFQIASLKLIGQLIILSSACQGIINFVGPIIIKDEIKFGVGVDFSLGSFWFILAIGLFFIFLSKVFENAKNLKDENELTV
jgi:NADH:ubiquinone oxidoreductase subunit K